MDFRHVTVAAIEKHTARTIADFKSAMATWDDETAQRFHARTRMIDGILVKKETADFAEAIRKANRAVKFGVSNTCKQDWVRFNAVIFEELHAYIPGQQYSLGRFGHADHQVGKTEHKYCVYARGIANSKYQPHRVQYHMVLSKDMPRALTAAMKYLRPYSAIECARMSFKEFRNGIVEANNRLTQAYVEARDKVLGGIDLRTELFLMLESGYQFSNAALHANVTNWKKEYTTMTNATKKASHGFYVQLTLSGEKQSFEVVEVFDIKKGENSSNWTTTVYDADGMPAELTEKIATLMMIDTMQYIEGVGMRTSERAFWIERDQA